MLKSYKLLTVLPTDTGFYMKSSDYIEELIISNVGILNSDMGTYIHGNYEEEALRTSIAISKVISRVQKIYNQLSGVNKSIIIPKSCDELIVIYNTEDIDSMEIRILEESLTKEVTFVSEVGGPDLIKLAVELSEIDYLKL